MGLKPLEFADCLTDSPLFRTQLEEHEQKLKQTSKGIKTLIQHGKQVFEAARALSKAQRQFANDLQNFEFECIETDDEIKIAKSVAGFGKDINEIEDLRDQMIETTEQQFVKRLEAFSTDDLGRVKAERKNFEKETKTFCQSQERYLDLKSKTKDNQLAEADAQIQMEQRGFYQASMKYVLKLQEMHEKKKFEFVEIVLSYMLGWLTFYHNGYEHFGEFRQTKQDLLLLLQETRERFQDTSATAERLMSKMLEFQETKPMFQSPTMKDFTHEGYLYLLEKKALSTTWSRKKYYCRYKKEEKEFLMISYNQLLGKMNEFEKYTIIDCVRRASDSIERRFCFDVNMKDPKDTKDKTITMTFQAVSIEERKLWLDAMDGREPVYHHVTRLKSDSSESETTALDATGFKFMRKCIAAIEKRGLDQQGLYRLVGVQSRIKNLAKMGLDPKKIDTINLDDESEWETKTITSVMKHYLRSLPEPLMTFGLYRPLIDAAKQESKTQRVDDILNCIKKLPKENTDMLSLLLAHLHKLSEKSEVNKMTTSNIGVCFGPTLMFPEEESVAAIMEMKFCTIVVEILIENYAKVFKPLASEKLSQISSSTIQRRASTPAPISSSSSIGMKTGVWQRAPHVYESIETDHLTTSKSPLQTTDHKPPLQTNTAEKPKKINVKWPPEPASTLKPCQPSVNNPPVIKPQRQSRCENLSYGLVNISAKPLTTDSKVSDDSATNSNYESLTLGRTRLNSSNQPRRSVITLFQCIGSHKTELSFEKDQIITNVGPSKEPGWLEGELNGIKGLIPENYVKYLDA